MRTIPIAACIFLTGCAASGTGALSASSPASQTASAMPLADEAELEVTMQLDLSASAPQEERVVCRRETPVGSRIPITRCYPTNPAETAESIALEEQQRLDLEEMRRQSQLLLEQQRMQSALGGNQL